MEEVTTKKSSAKKTASGAAGGAGTHDTEAEWMERAAQMELMRAKMEEMGRIIETLKADAVPRMTLAPTVSMASAPLAQASPLWDLQTEWFGLLGSNTSVTKNREILSAIETQATYYKVPADVLHARILRYASTSPDVANYANTAADGYALISILRGTLEAKLPSKTVIMRTESMTAETFFREAGEALSQEDRLLKNRKNTLTQIAYRDRTLPNDKLQTLIAEIEKEDDSTMTKDNAQLFAQLVRLWTKVKAFMGAKTHQSEDGSNRKKRKRDGNPSSPSTAHTPSSSSSASNKKPKRVPTRPCAHCNGEHFDWECPTKPQSAVAETSGKRAKKSSKD